MEPQLPKDDKKDDWKREVAEVLKKYGKVDEKTVGKMQLVINCGGITTAEWLNRKVE